MGIGYNPKRRFEVKEFNYEEQAARMAIHRQWVRQTSPALQVQAYRSPNWSKNLRRWFNSPSKPRYAKMPRRFRGITLGR